MLGRADMDNSFFTDMHDIYVTLDKADYKNLDQAGYTRLKGALDIATEKMADAADIYVLLAQIVNDLYTIILSDNNTIGDSNEVNASKDIIRKSKAVFEDEQDLDEIAVLFEAFEGKQERILEAIMSADFATQYAFGNLKEKLADMSMLDMYKDLDVIQKLQTRGIWPKISDLSDALNLPRPGVTRTVKEMEHKGYLRKQVSAEDGRVTYLFLTESGQALSQKYNTDYFSQLLPYLDGISEEDAACTIQTLEKFYAIMCERKDSLEKR